MKKIFLCIMTLLLFNMIKAQTEDDIPTDVDVDSKTEPGYLLSDRNYPDIILDSYKVVSCRKADSIPVCFYRNYSAWNYKQNPLQKKIEDLTNEDKNCLCQLAWNTRNEKYFDLLGKLIYVDTLKKDRDIRLQMLMNLAAFNTTTSKKMLLKLLHSNDNEIATISALILIQFGDYDTGFNYLNQHSQNTHFPVQVYSALMRINSSKSVELLKRLIKEETDPACSLDGLAALALMGHCDYAFKEFVNYTKSNNQSVRTMAVSCLAFYIGTPKAFNIIKEMQTDKSLMVEKEVIKVLENFNQSKF